MFPPNKLTTIEAPGASMAMNQPSARNVLNQTIYPRSQTMISSPQMTYQTQYMEPLKSSTTNGQYTTVSIPRVTYEHSNTYQSSAPFSRSVPSTYKQAPSYLPSQQTSYMPSVTASYQAPGGASMVLSSSSQPQQQTVTSSYVSSSLPLPQQHQSGSYVSQPQYLISGSPTPYSASAVVTQPSQSSTVTYHTAASPSFQHFSAASGALPASSSYGQLAPSTIPAMSTYQHHTVYQQQPQLNLQNTYSPSTYVSQAPEQQRPSTYLDRNVTTFQPTTYQSSTLGTSGTVTYQERPHTHGQTLTTYALGTSTSELAPMQSAAVLDPRPVEYQNRLPPTAYAAAASDGEPKLAPEYFRPIAVGDKLPTAHIDLHGVCVNLQEFFEDRCGILFGLVGAFNPVDTKKAVPEILRCMDSFEKQVDFVGCLVVNDPFVVKAWAKRLGITDQFTFVADSDAKFTKALGMAQYLPEEGLGIRSRRFAIVVGPRSKIQWVGFDDDSFAASVLQVVPRFVRTPWKSFLVGISYDKKNKAEIDSQPSITQALQTIRVQLAHQGFCSEPDWQLMLSDQIPNIFKPTRENIMSGLKWLVEGTQAGDVLCLYFAGRGSRIVYPDGTETVGLLPMDHETAPVITEWELYEVLAANVPEFCRLTIILDIEGEEPVHCPMPYNAPYLQANEADGNQTVQLMPMSALNEAWLSRFQMAERPKGEILTLSLEGPGQVPQGCLASLMNTTTSTELRDPISEESSEQPQIVEIPISFKDKMDRMTNQLQEWGLQRYVVFGSSFPLDLKEDFSLADILPQENLSN
eukprot:Gregarina_sp_Poly_1__5863@NODE_308_length_9647_cov_165_896660_g265_i0_p1_GENE_NODE_308_length_9647_cov_165_896660_g265_i0NODE_308_length_9647_cov_165_896660_g265_i0_p1_ORF_typecomplete_len802_score91_76Peptidase_C14/PF00656_22/9_4e02Peptidase_C14/PF00656_22/1_6e14Redoxin/PF08534_10/8_3e14AhpCTSA/PF00578_21/8_5e05_NODE_308_length_9647_cov_165_896660_g265_i09253330